MSDTPATRLDRAWEALRDDVLEAIDADSVLMLMDAIAANRPLIEAAVLEAARERVEGLREKRERLDALYRTYGNDGSRTGSAVAEAALLGIGIYDAVLAALREEGT